MLAKQLWWMKKTFFASASRSSFFLECVKVCNLHNSKRKYSLDMQKTWWLHNVWTNKYIYLLDKKICNILFIEISKIFFWKKSISHCLKITLNIAFLILAFSINFCDIKIDLSGNTVWPQTSDCQKTRHNWPFLAFLINFC